VSAPFVLVKAALAGAGALGLLLLAPVEARSTAAPTPPADSLRDPALAVGTLPNGLRYYVRRNAMPAGRAVLWLAVNAGSVHEDDDQRGYAHFLEHMAFNGTTHFPRQSLVDFIETSGMEFGADLNAYTSFDETVYQLTLPTDEPQALGRGLTILADWAGGGITMDSVEVVAERGVVMGEWRSRALLDTLNQRLQTHVYDVLFGRSRYRHRLPIGLPARLEAATPAPLERFYRDWYRPDLMAVVAVGDFEPAAMEREIRERFGAIPKARRTRRPPEPALAMRGAPLIDVLRDKVEPGIDLLWPAAARPRDARAAVRHDLTAELLLQHVQRTLLRIRERSSRPFVHAEIGRSRPVRPMDIVTGSIVAQPDSLERALGAVLTELERVAQHGIPAAALERGKASLLRQLEHQAASAAAQPSTAYATAYVQHYLTGEGPLLSPAQELELARELLPAITPETLAEAARFWRERRGLKMLVRVPQFAFGFRPPTRESVLALWDSIARTPLPEDSTPAAAADGPLMATLPSPGRIAAESLHARAGVVEWRLSNGARVLFKPSRNNPDELLLRAWSPGGFSLVPDSLFFSSGRMVAHMMTEAAGLGTQDRDDLLQQLATTTVQPLKVEIGYAHEAIELGGSPKELETLFQLLHLQFTAPKLDTAALATWQSVAKYQYRPASIHDALDQISARGNPRLAPVQTHLAELARLEEALAVYRDRFGNAGDFTFFVVGAARAEEVRPLVERYLASLPASDARETPKDPEIRPKVGKDRRFQKVLEVPRSETLLAFDGSFPTGPDEYLRERRRLAALMLVLERRLRDRLREQLGGTYGVAVSGDTYRLYDEHFRVLISFQSAPERMRELTKEMQGILDSLRAHGATAAELAKGARIQQRRLEAQLQDNRFWLAQLELYNRLRLPLDRIVAPYPAGSLTPDELVQAAARYLPETSAIHLTNAPRDSIPSAYP
jgi:zinc protease